MVNNRICWEVFNIYFSVYDDEQLQHCIYLVMETLPVKSHLPQYSWLINYWEFRI